MPSSRQARRPRRFGASGFEITSCLRLRRHRCRRHSTDRSPRPIRDGLSPGSRATKPRCHPLSARRWRLRGPRPSSAWERIRRRGPGETFTRSRSHIHSSKRRRRPELLIAHCRDLLPHGKQAAAKITCPIQVIIAGQDRMAPREATTELVAHLNNPEVHVIPESGHMVPQEAPNKCRQLLKTLIFANNPAT